MNKIEFFPKAKLAEIYQTSGVQFSFITTPANGNKQCHPWVKCRDFLHDAIRAYITKEAVEVYNFEYDRKINPPIDLRRTRLIVKDTKNKKNDFIAHMFRALHIINIYENIAGTTTSNITFHDSEDGTICYFNGPGIWMKACALISMYTFLIRLGEYNINTTNIDTVIASLKNIGKKDTDNNDLNYTYYTYKYMHYIMDNINNLFLNNKRFESALCSKHAVISVRKLHNYSGIKSLCTNLYSVEVTKTKMAKLKKDIDEALKAKKTKLTVIAQEHKQPIIAYKPDILLFAMVSSPKNDRKTCAEFTTCKEELAGSIRDILTRKSGNAVYSSFALTEAPLDQSKFRIAFYTPGIKKNPVLFIKNKKDLFAAKKLLNIYEAYIGISKSLISTVNIKFDNTDTIGWLLTGDVWWQQSPILLTALLSILRTGKQDIAKAGDVVLNTIEDIENLWKNSKDEHILKIHKFLIAHSKKITKLFSKNIEENYYISPNNTAMKYYTKTGIISLINNKHIDNKFTKIYKSLEASK
jgi:hypothetical protein